QEVFSMIIDGSGSSFDIKTLLDLKTLLDGLIGALAGGLVALFAIRAENRNKRVEVSFAILERYMSEFAELGEVKGLLARPESLAGAATVNRVIRFGDWYDIVAALVLARIAEKSILDKVGMKGEMRSFMQAVVAAGAKVPTLKTSMEQWDSLTKYTK